MNLFEKLAAQKEKGLFRTDNNPPEEADETFRKNMMNEDDCIIRALRKYSYTNAFQDSVEECNNEIAAENKNHHTLITAIQLI